MDRRMEKLTVGSSPASAVTNLVAGARTFEVNRTYLKIV
jgi:hypothetical protein